MDDKDKYYTYFILKSGFFCFSFILAMFGNIIIIAASIKYKTLQVSINILVCNLCLVDLLIMILGVPLFVLNDHLTFGNVHCKILHPMLSIFMTANVFTLVAIAIERYVVILNKDRSKFNLNIRKAFIVAIIVDVLALITGIPVMGSSMAGSNGSCLNTWSKKQLLIYQGFAFFIQYLAPLMTMTVFYLRIWYKIRSKNKVSIRYFNRNRSSTFSSLDSFEAHPSNFRSQESTSPSCKSDSKNHLAIYLSNRERSISANDLDNEDVTARHSLYFPVTETASSLKRSNSTSDVENVNGKKRTLFYPGNSLIRGSMKRIHRSLTSIIAGTDLFESHEELAADRYKQTMKTLKVFVCLLFVFIVSMLPFQLYIFFDIIHLKMDKYLKTLLTAPLYLNATINPLLYGAMNIQFQQAFTRLFSPSKFGIQEMMKKNLFRTKSGNVFMGNRVNPNSKKRRFFYLRDWIGRCLNKQNINNTIEYADARTLRNIKIEEINERKCSSSTTRKFSSLRKISRSFKLRVEGDSIPVCAPIIIITSYDDDQECPFL